jgi:hypothetical protein
MQLLLCIACTVCVTNSDCRSETGNHKAYKIRTKLERSGSEPTLRAITTFYSSLVKYNKKFVRLVGVLAKNRTGYLPNTSQQN